jgi:hypothetical protein
MSVLKTASFPSLIHNDEINEELVKWSQINHYPVNKAKRQEELNGFVGFAPTYYVKATRQPPIPGGWDVTVEDFKPETRIIPLNAAKDTGAINKFIQRMLKEYETEGVKLVLAPQCYESYGTTLRDVSVTGHPLLLDALEDFIENMR